MAFNVLITLTFLAPPPVEGPPDLPPEPRAFDAAGFAMDLPDEWDGVRESTDTAVVQLDELGGQLTVHRGRNEKSLARTTRAVERAARAERWRRVERRSTRVGSHRARVLVYDIEGSGVISRQLFYLLVADSELWVLHFGTRRDAFEYERYRKAAASFQPM